MNLTVGDFAVGVVATPIGSASFSFEYDDWLLLLLRRLPPIVPSLLAVVEKVDVRQKTIVLRPERVGPVRARSNSARTHAGAPLRAVAHLTVPLSMYRFAIYGRFWAGGSKITTAVAVVVVVVVVFVVVFVVTTIHDNDFLFIYLLVLTVGEGRSKYPCSASVYDFIASIRWSISQSPLDAPTCSVEAYHYANSSPERRSDRSGCPRSITPS